MTFFSAQEHDPEHDQHLSDTVASRKRPLRKAAIARRKAVPADDRATAAAALANAAQSLIDELLHAACESEQDDAAPNCAPTVAAYVSMGSEIAMDGLLRVLLDAGCRVLVPRLGTGLDVGWSELNDMDTLRDVPAVPAGNVSGANAEPQQSTASAVGTHVSHRPQEPDTEVLGPQALAQADLVIVPALAVDALGVRLGRGGGWYDRALAFRRDGVRVIAVCWPWETLCDPLPREDHDVPVDGVLTPEGYSPRPLCQGND
ncbi:5-formyltetrahydrofolate cyclo-ligase [Bifidobacterium goeldii]|uniref:5-formyltetrahydrofolate cyclo-ligase n=1 Tax=Bifidobacterium goeldii TaxID=2306975 RepID=A0A430FJ22_9BIFI|nr:5-formyltetrahydrofolate cyclo-ligase [Bifidobacterium goeldii]RSX52905.1 5-formyltetrahydrofolate cyclo-ligase [Bifidobacterium goeldii]